MNIDCPVLKLAANPDSLTVEFADGTACEFASVWLRDNLDQQRDSHSGQRLIDVVDLPERPRIRAAQLNGDRIEIEWQGETAPGQATSITTGALSAQAASLITSAPELTVTPWLEAATMNAATDFAWATIADLTDRGAAKLEWLTRLLQTGMAFLKDVPPTSSAILEAMAEVGRICETNYGSVFDVRSVPQPENLAYSDLGLGLHTDNPYRNPVPGFQALHTLATSDTGGHSVFADGFALAEHLRTRDPQAFELLTHTPVPFRYRSATAELYAERPLIRLSCTGQVEAVHYNNRSVAPLRLPAQQAKAFYAAYRRFASLLRDPTFQLTYRLGDGDLVVFDNQRVLHGRTAFSGGQQIRHLRGCYLTRDSVYSEAALLRRLRTACTS